MGKASSAKNVARVARVGGKSAKQRRNVGFPLAIAALFALGVLAVAMVKISTADDKAAAADQVPKLNDHIHMAYGVNDCGTWLDTIPQPPTDPYGIHTHGDDVIHIHPFSASAAGKNAKLSVFDDLIGMKTSKTSLSYPGVSLKGDCGGKPAVLRIGYWNSAFGDDGKPTTAPPDKIYTDDFGSIPLNHDRGALTYWWGPADSTIQLPPSVPELNQLSDLGQAPPPSVDVPGAGGVVPPAGTPEGGVVPPASPEPGASVPPAGATAPDAPAPGLAPNPEPPAPVAPTSQN